MGRPKGSKNRSARELETAGKHLIEKAKLKRRIEKLNNKGK